MHALASLLLVAAALSVARTAAPVHCSYAADGWLEGEPTVWVAPELPRDRRRFSVAIPYEQACGARRARGAALAACDALPPRLHAHGARADVLRLGPLWAAPALYVTVFCAPADPADPEPDVPATAAPPELPTTPDAPPDVTAPPEPGPAPGPVVVPVS